VRGLFEADGTVMPAGYPAWSTTSLSFSYDVQQLLLALGFPTTRKMDVTGSGASPLAVLRLLNLSFNEAFLKDVGFMSERKRCAVRTADLPQAGRKDHIPMTRTLIERLTKSNARLRDVLLTQYRRHAAVSRRIALELHAQTQDAELGHLLSFFYDRVSFAELGEEELTYDLSVPENVTYIANGFVSHNTIGLLMDCDTTGVEPDFSLVKFKKLAGGGYFKIVNQSVPEALETLGYAEHELQEIVAYICGTNTLLAAPHVNRAKLLQLGLTKEELDKVEAALPSVFDLAQAFAPWVIGEAAYERLGVPGYGDKKKEPKASLLRHLGFSSQAIQEASDHIVGRMTIEGAPHLKEEHLPVFDCANRCGRLGKRYLAPMSHVKMMAAVQPFISGAISKTVNLPNEATVDEVQQMYEEGWRLGLKAVALYRDGCKASQPLSTKDDGKNDDDKAETKSEPVVVVETKPVETKPIETKAPLHPTAIRVRLPHKRTGFTQEARVGGHKIFLRTGEYLDGTLGEIFIDMHKEGAAFRSLMNCFAMSVSIGLQYGVPLATYVDQYTFTRFEPQGSVEGHDNIKFATSIVDYVFRVLGVEYLSRYDLAHVVPTPAPIEDPSDTRAAQETAAKEEPPAAAPASLDEGASSLDQQLEDMMGDAPVCDGCGHITVRNGACYKCLNCGNSLGCS
jgi:ribonucleoside-diphosphate reductase alpha chain